MPAEMKKYIAKFHIFLAIAIIGAYAYILINLKSTFPKLAEALFTSYYECRKARDSLQVVLILPFISVLCFLFPRWLTTRFSPRTRLLGEPIITEGGWYLLGHLLIALAAIAFLGFA
jgi:hypothetical protein